MTRDNGAFGSRFWLGSTSLGKFDAIHASPPCQRYSTQTACRPGLAAEYPDLIAATRAMLDGSGVAYVIENVAGARKELRHPTMLCGAMFGKQTYRHRFFETTSRSRQSRIQNTPCRRAARATGSQERTFPLLGTFHRSRSRKKSWRLIG